MALSSSVIQNLVVKWSEQGDPARILANVERLSASIERAGNVNISRVFSALASKHQETLSRIDALQKSGKLSAEKAATARGNALMYAFTRPSIGESGAEIPSIKDQLIALSKIQGSYRDIAALERERLRINQLIAAQKVRQAQAITGQSAAAISIAKREEQAANRLAAHQQKMGVLQTNAENELKKDSARKIKDQKAMYALQSRAENEMRADEIKTLKKVEQARKAAYSASPIGALAGQWEKFWVVFRRVADALGSFMIINSIVSAIRGFFSSIVSSNAQLEVMDARLSSISRGGGSFDMLRKSIIDLTVTTPFVISDLIEATAKLEGFGVSAKKYLPVVADWAAAIGRDIQDMAVAFSKIAVGSPRTAMLLGTRGINKAVFDRELAATGSAAKALANIIERYYGGMAIRLSQTFTGLVSNIKDMWFVLSQAVGSSLFVRLRRDVESLYLLMDSMRKSKDTVTTLGAVAKAIGQLYDVVQDLLPLFAAFVGWKLWGKLATYLSGVATALKVSTSAIGYFAAALVVSTEVTRAQQSINGLTQSLRELNEVSEKSPDDIGKRINAIETAMVRLKTVTEGSGVSWVLFFWKSLKGFIDDAWKSQNFFVRDFAAMLNTYMSLVRVFIPETKKLDIYESLSKSLQDQHDWLIQIRAVDQAILDIDSARLTTNESLEERERAEKGGALGFLGKLKAKIQAYSMFPGMYGSDTARKNLEVALANVSEVTDNNIKALQEKRRLELESNVWSALEATLRPGAGKEAQDELNVARKAYVDFMFDIVDKSTKATVTLKDFSDEMAELMARRRELLLGESIYTSRIAGNMAEVSELDKQIAQKEKESKGTNTELNYLGELRIKRERAFNAVIEDRQRIREREIDAEVQGLQAIRNLEEARVAYSMKQRDYQYELTGNLHDKNLMEQESLERLDEEIKARRQSLEFQSSVIIPHYRQFADKKEFNDQLTIETRMKQDLLDLDVKRLEIQERLLSSVSEDFPAAFAKTFRVLRNGLNDFYDEFTDLFVSGIRETTTGIIMDLLYGESGKDGLAEARYELASIRAEMSQAAYESSQMQRREGETNEEYAARMQLFEGAAASQQQMYVFKTQELEQMERINELERERNNLIYDRLRALGQKLTEKLMDYAIGSLMNMAFQGLSGPNYRDPGMVEAGYPGNNRPSSVGNTYVISGNTIYGMDDFDRKVGDSIRRIETRQRA